MFNRINTTNTGLAVDIGELTRIIELLSASMNRFFRGDTKT
jgi:hypothetical protein